jgi:hypothetical protein
MRKLLAGVGLLFCVVAYGAWKDTVAGQATPIASMTIVCSPCSGASFNVPADEGMVLRNDQTGELWFYPLTSEPRRVSRVGAAQMAVAAARTMFPVRVGVLPFAGAPVQLPENRSAN